MIVTASPCEIFSPETFDARQSELSQVLDTDVVASADWFAAGAAIAGKDFLSADVVLRLSIFWRVGDSLRDPVPCG